MCALIQFKNIIKSYTMGDITINASDGVDFEVNKGEFVVIVGASGAGKTTILNLLGGMDIPTKGSILVDGENVALFDEKRLTEYRRDDIGFVFQFYNLVQNLTALENVELASQISKDPLDPRNILERVGLADRMMNFPAQLSGGEQQRVAIARAIVNNPRLLICDEPTGNLDPDTSKEIMKILEAINKELGTTIIMATHDRDIVNRMKKRVLVIENGVLAGDYLKGSYKAHESIKNSN